MSALLYENEEDASKAKRYSKTRLKALAAKTLWTIGGLSLFASTGASKSLKNKIEQSVPDPRLVKPTYVAAVIGASWLWDLPASYFTGLKIERKFELTKQSNSGWARDQAIGLGVEMALAVPALTVANEIMNRRPRDWWLILSAATIPVSVVLSNLAPVIIMPLFNKFEPLADGELSKRISELAERSGVSIAGVYKIDMSRQSEKANAFFTGVGNTKRIVLADTLLERFTEDETVGVVAHELAHQVHRDMWTLIGMGSGSTLLAAWAVKQAGPTVIAKTEGLTRVDDMGDISALPVIGLTLAVVGASLTPINAAISRFFERRADRFAVEETRDGRSYASTLTRLGRQNLADPSPSRLVTTLLYSHPPIPERIQRALAFDKTQGGETAKMGA